jgi:hypothetical protein
MSFFGLFFYWFRWLDYAAPVKSDICKLVLFITGYILWNIDNQFCNNLRSIRDSIGLPWAWLLELHGWYVSYSIVLSPPLSFLMSQLFLLPSLHTLNSISRFLFSVRVMRTNVLPTTKVAYPHWHSSLPAHLARRMSLPDRLARAAAVGRSYP